MNWRVMFPKAFIRHLPQINYDHNPLLLSLDNAHVPCPNLKHFIFEAMWMQHDDYDQLLSSAWSEGNLSILNKSKTLVPTLLKWNKEVFGCLFQKKKKVFLPSLRGFKEA